ncbi:MAG: hypothetical protein KDC10_07155 [Calditrichaeota bacterium]|nr:hypothetical protein [Candidatus Cloacimonadota bacterium]MCB1046966.1 hypothetical protein [Calditrichota bacterium]MCB9472231.1 hypothetical protein [Candidatus Delongbacteria bacterium]
MIPYTLRGGLLAVLLLSLSASAGPLSRGGWGQLEWTANAADAGRGGTGLAISDSLRIPLRNPAAVSGGRLTRIQLGLGARGLTAIDNTTSTSDVTGSFDQFYLSFPLTWNRVSASLGLRPWSRMDFSLRNHDSNSEGEEYYEFLKGSGGFSLATVTFARDWPAQNLKVGLETGLIFGSLRQEYSLYHVQVAPPFDVRTNYRLGMVGPSLRLGALWQPTPELGLGLAGNLPTRARLSLDRESASNNDDSRQALGHVDVPLTIDLGAALRQNTIRWLADLSWSDWSSTQLAGNSAADLSLARRQDSALSLALGVERLHEDDFTLAWYRKWDWRTGLRFEQGYLAYNKAALLGGADEYKDVNLLSLSAGCSIPTRDRLGWMDLGFEYTLSGDKAGLGLEEQGWRLHASFAGSDLWFRRPVYNR